MIFKHSIRALAQQYFSVRDYALIRKISEEEAKAELMSFATGNFFPDRKTMLAAFPAQKDLQNEWQRGLVAYYAKTRKKEMVAAGIGLDVIYRWSNGIIMPSKASFERLKAAGLDLKAVPEEARFVYVESPKQLIRFDSRRNKLVLFTRSYPLVQLWHNAFVLTFESTSPGISFHLQDDIRDSGLIFVNEGRFLRAVIPATEVNIYMYNHEHTT